MDIDQLAPAYADVCYKNESFRSMCRVFIKPNVPLTVKDTPCPFANSTWCATKEAVNVDSGLLDVGVTFGLNMANKDRVQFRKSTTCSVLPVEGHWGVYHAKDHVALQSPMKVLSNDEMAVVSYGTSFSGPSWLTNVTGQPNVHG
jgi:hypothetical protein